MDRLCDEIVQIILNELDDPTSLSLLSKRFHQFTQDPYVRSSYFLSRYGRNQALYWALGRGRLMNERVIDILISSGAHLSRYLAQCAIHHYFRTQVPFIKTRWVRTMSFPVFSYFMSAAARLYGDIPTGKNEDDGAIFTALLKSSRFPMEARAVKWEIMKEVLEKYKFIPFSNKDPMMVQFPLVLAIEPRLLPYARANGFSMDRKYRNFVFRKMFEKPAIYSEGRADEIVANVRELSRLDPQWLMALRHMYISMFLSRTVAAEICMEARTNEPAYAALKRLDKEGALRFELSSVAEDLTKLFINTRSVSIAYTHQVLRELHSDYPSQDPVVRLVLLCTIFFSEHGTPLPSSLVANIFSSSSLNAYVNACKEKVESMGLGPVTRKDLFDLLVNKFTPDRFGGVLEYGRVVVGLDDKDVETLLQEVALACLEIGCKGKMLKKLVESNINLSDVIASYVLRTFRLSIDDLPPSEDEKACRDFEARLCRDFVAARRPGYPVDVVIIDREHATDLANEPEAVSAAVAEDEDGEDEVEDALMGSGEHATEVDEDLGPIGQDTLTTMIRKDELAPSRRRRFYEMYTSYNDSMSKLTYPADYQQVGRWVRTHYGRRSAVTAIFMLHAVLNETAFVLQPSLYNEPIDILVRVPITLKHFKMLARLGRAPNSVLFDDIEAGTEFYFSEEDYLQPEDFSGAAASNNKARSRKVKVKTECNVKADVSSGPWFVSDPSNSKPRSGTRGKKRPRRSTATAIKSYVVPDSDDEEIAEGKADDHAKKRRSETNLQRWIKHLTALQKEEQKKYKEKKKREQAVAAPGSKIRVFKSDFLKSLTTNLTRLRKADREKREQLYGVDVPSEDYSEGEEDEYQDRTTRSKRRKVFE